VSLPPSLLLADLLLLSSSLFDFLLFCRFLDLPRVRPLSESELVEDRTSRLLDLLRLFSLESDLLRLFSLEPDLLRLLSLELDLDLVRDLDLEVDLDLDLYLLG
jgi:hypothetical protein